MHWQVGSLPLSHQGSFLMVFWEINIYKHLAFKAGIQGTSLVKGLILWSVSLFQLMKSVSDETMMIFSYSTDRYRSTDYLRRLRIKQQLFHLVTLHVSDYLKSLSCTQFNMTLLRKKEWPFLSTTGASPMRASTEG